ncbi:MAG TPA: DUF6456 domain-containing protein [Pseudolabrys sp.]|nr:DUF6456 domain-containing protein [Pseudolabrys sp.]
MKGRNQKQPACLPHALHPHIDRFRAQHLNLSRQRVAIGNGYADVTVDEAESPLVWLARRRGRDGRPLIASHQLQAGERLRADFTRACIMPSTTSNWSNPINAGRRAGSDRADASTEAMIAARQRIHLALNAVGPEFSGLLLDICCFLKSLDDIERERAWPARSAKVVLQLALDCLARHYGFQAQAKGPARSKTRTWLAPGETFVVADNQKLES